MSAPASPGTRESTVTEPPPSRPPFTSHTLRRGIAWMLLSLAGFACMALLVSYLGSTRNISPWMALFFRAVVGLTVIMVLDLSRQEVRYKRLFTEPKLITRGVLGAIGTACYYLTLPALGAGKATLIANTWVIFAAIAAAFVLGESLTVRKVIGIILALIGISFLMGLQTGELTHIGRYEIIAIIGALFAAWVVVVIRQLTATESNSTIFGSQCVYTGLVSLPFLLSTPFPAWPDFLMLITAGALAALGQLAMTQGFRLLPVSIGGAIQILAPLVITIASALIFHEHFTPTQIGGGSLILFGCYLTVAMQQRAKTTT